MTFWEISSCGGVAGGGSTKAKSLDSRASECADCSAKGTWPTDSRRVEAREAAHAPTRVSRIDARNTNDFRRAWFILVTVTVVCEFNSSGAPRMDLND